MKKQRAPRRSMSLGELVALAFDAAERITPKPRVAAVLATLSLDAVLREQCDGRVGPRIARALQR